VCLRQPDKLERPGRLERPGGLERPERLERPGGLEPLERLERPERLERLERLVNREKKPSKVPLALSSQWESGCFSRGRERGGLGHDASGLRLYGECNMSRGTHGSGGR
jgi:hypothetical protein